MTLEALKIPSKLIFLFSPRPIAKIRFPAVPKLLYSIQKLIENTDESIVVHARYV